MLYLPDVGFKAHDLILVGEKMKSPISFASVETIDSIECACDGVEMIDQGSLTDDGVCRSVLSTYRHNAFPVVNKELEPLELVGCFCVCVITRATCVCMMARMHVF